MENLNKNQLILLLSASSFRTLTDSFATGLLFAISMKFIGESVAALTSSITLLLIFIFSPLFGMFIDRRFFSPKLSGGLYILTGLCMPLFLTNLNFLVILYVNLLFLVLFNIPASLYLSSWSSLVFKGKPATGYALLASTNTLFNIFGTILGSFLVENNILSYWVGFKFVTSILVGLCLIFIFTRVDSHVFIANGKNNGKIMNKILKDPQLISTTNKGIFYTTFVNLRLFRSSLTKKIKAVDNYVLLFSICITFFSISRTFFLTNVAFKVFEIFDKNVFWYTLIINTAALTAFVFYPFNGKIADFVGNWNYYTLGVVLTPFYLVSFIIFTNNILLVVLWALPVGVITDVSQIGVISVMTKPEERNSAIGLITSANALGSVIGAFCLSLAVNHSMLLNIFLIITVIIPFIMLIPLIFIKTHQLSIQNASKPISVMS